MVILLKNKWRKGIGHRTEPMYRAREHNVQTGEHAALWAAGTAGQLHPINPYRRKF
jgi:hypothetical protein